MENLILDFRLNRNKIDFILAWNGWLAFAYFFFSFSLFSPVFLLNFDFRNFNAATIKHNASFCFQPQSSFPFDIQFVSLSFFLLFTPFLHGTRVNVNYKHNLSYFHYPLSHLLRKKKQQNFFFF